MGYYTRYELSQPIITEEIEKVIYELDIDYPLIDGDSCKWYNHEDDMRKLSLQFRDMLFELNGYGEEAGDLWIKYFKNGKMQYCPAIISFVEYDESLLS